MSELGQVAGMRSSRAVQEGVPATKEQRERVLAAARERVREGRLVGPLTLEELRREAGAAARAAGLGGSAERYLPFAAVAVNNEVWRERLAAAPYERRLLLLPKCLRDPRRCRGRTDAFGLVCGRCGACIIDDLHEEAEQLGYVVMVAEGSPAVTALIESGQVEAVIGVSCLGVLERVFGYMEAAAIPGMAIPLLQDGCANTSVDLDWVWDALHATTEDATGRLDLEALRVEVEGFFTEAALERAMGRAASETERLARGRLTGPGKRWRPFLTACVYQALQEEVSRPLPEELGKVAAAVECFHKASLIHDDIEDGDAARYGAPTLHEQHGVAVALNVGDFLLGEGYRLLGELGAAAGRRAALAATAAAGHRALCLGQGAELCWRCARSGRRVLRPGEVIEIFEQKTAPAFEVALRLGALYAGADEELGETLKAYSRALGVAYQIQDDLADSGLGEKAGDGQADEGRPSLMAALGYERAGGEERGLLERVWAGRASEGDRERLREVLRGLGVEESGREMLGGYKNEAIRALGQVRNPHLKGVLRRVLGKIFREGPAMGCCDEHTRGHAEGG